MVTLIADSGSTKTDWVLINGKSVLSAISTIGFNPYFQTTDQIVAELSEHLKPAISQHLPAIKHIYYYGAGCSNEANCKILMDSIRGVFPTLKVEINHDLLAAARSLCGTEPGIACILGTGSNSCLYDGKSVLENIPSVGYLFGDDGSGANIGKTFIQAYFDGLVPEKLKAEFENASYHREEILDNVYKKGMPSKYLASVSKFVAAHIKDPYARKLVKGCFKNFFAKQIGRYTNSRDYKVHSVGSVGFYYKDVLAEVANEEGYKLGNVIKSPIDGLINYHQSMS